MVDFAGLSNKVKVILGNVNNDNLIRGNALRNKIIEKHGQDYLDILFIDHDKKMYLNDLNVIEEAGLLRTNSVVVADNVLSFNSPLELYLQHVRDDSERGSNLLIR
jgi:catechol O-methyltransferase